jgi:hypothetical protein
MPTDREILQEAAFPHRHRGAPRGNRNALKHGFPLTSKTSKKARIPASTTKSSCCASNPAASSSSASQPQNLSESALSLVALSINRLIRAQLTLSQPDNPIQDALHQALFQLGAYPGDAFDTPSPNLPPAN